MNKLLKGFITNDSTSNISSKRVTLLILILLLVIIVVANIFFNKHIDEFIFNGLIDVIIWNLGFIGAVSMGFKGMNPSKYNRRDSYPDLEVPDDEYEDPTHDPNPRRRKRRRLSEGNQDSEEDMN